MRHKSLEAGSKRWMWMPRNRQRSRLCLGGGVQACKVLNTRNKQVLALSIVASLFEAEYGVSAAL